MIQRKAIITGHSRGLGSALTEQMLAAGIPVLALARQNLPQHAGLQQHRLDLASSEALQTWLEHGELASFVADAGEILLINNAGTLGPVAQLGQQHDIAQALSLNVSTPLILADAVARFGRPCRILHISSGAARTPYAGWSIYGATKAALDHHARCVAQEKQPHVRICSLAPGVIDTEMQAEIRRTPAERFPLLPRFLALKAESALTPPASAARQVLAYLLDAGFGQDAVADIRQL